MPNDITKAVSANDIRNGSVVCTCPVSGNFITDNSGDQGDGKTPDQSRDKKNDPSLAEIQDKFDERFDDVQYYTS